MSGKAMTFREVLIYRGWSKEAASFLVAHQDDPRLSRLKRRLTGAGAVPRPPRPKRTKAIIPPDIRWAVWERDDFTCLRCGTRRNLSVDHIVAEALGGTLDLSNLQTLCSRCNSSKGKGP